MKGPRIFTIGFAGRSAESFFEALQSAGVRAVVDIRLNNASQLAGFTKKRDLEYFLDAVAGIKYVHAVELAPSPELFDAFKRSRSIGWDEFERRFNDLLASRDPAKRFRPEDLDGACLLCSEPEPQQCHRRLVAEYFQKAWTDVAIVHL